MPCVEIQGKRYFYAGERTGAGLPLLFCHGSGGSHRHWLYQLAGLTFPVNPLAVDLPGHGRSEGSAQAGSPFTAIGLKNGGSSELIPLCPGRHSMGGAIALDYALQYPGDLAGLILVGTGGRLRVAPAILDSLREGALPAGMSGLLYGPEAPAELVKEGEREMRETPPGVFLADFTACDRFDRMSALEQITCPCLVICGSADRLTPLKYSRFLHEMLPAARLVEISGAGHMVMVEAPEQVNKAITAFIKELHKD